MSKDDIQFIKNRRNHFSNIIVAQNRLPKKERDQRLLAQAKDKNKRLNEWLKDMEN